MAQDDYPFEPRVGRSRRDSARPPRATQLRAEILKQVARRGGNPRRLGDAGAVAAPRTGRFNARGRGARIAAAVPRGSGWSFDRGSGMRVRPRRVTVKARVVKLAGKATAVRSHLRYLERDGVSREGEPGRFYSTFADDADGKAFAERGAGDRHQFRFIVAPEDGPAFDHLREFTRNLMAKMEEDLGTTLDWVAVDHFDTGHPHSHIPVTGITEDGKTLNIAGDYIAHGIRHRGSQIMTRALGPQSELEVRHQLEREVDAERLTRLDRMMLAQAGDKARDQVIDLRGQEGQRAFDPGQQQLLIARARVLERMELAQPSGPLAWRLAPHMEQTLIDMGLRGDIIRLMHREMTQEKAVPGTQHDRYVVHGIDKTPEHSNVPIIGRVVKRGTADDEHERRYLIVDGVDGHSHYVDIGASSEPTPIGGMVSLTPKQAEARDVDQTVARIAHAHGGRYTIDIHLSHDPTATESFAQTHVRRLEAIRRAIGKPDRDPDGTWKIGPDHLDTALGYEQRKLRAEPVKVEMLSSTSILEQTGVHAATRLDRELVATDRTVIADTGYGADVRKALALRQQWLVEQQLAERQGDDVLYRPNLLRILRDREMRAVAGQLSTQMGLQFTQVEPNERVEGTLRRRVDMTSGRFALIERARDFTLVPWREDLERHVGKPLSGIMREGRSINWTIGRGRSGPSIGGM
ncbi:type IV secretion system protein VirD2 [Sphingobium sp. SCG-1]|uniref:relaxase/mobilization nuclease RlxS n=1 Tax=Sphingobium sp. SCG-1 TaxID=2072936 RepID=UPI000CD6BE52|nr:relaxase/mobilization nuclease RlxS [Sphingobium sp. SCG-1]AUW60183.1 type IV secretion system protein VirD2 [Sphingobium sp. SCG-1]